MKVVESYLYSSKGKGAKEALQSDVGHLYMLEDEVLRLLSECGGVSVGPVFLLGITSTYYCCRLVLSEMRYAIDELLDGAKVMHLEVLGMIHEDEDNDAMMEMMMKER
ncbi:hypothetical protein Tco_0508765 [Tanacetum coccineum]